MWRSILCLFLVVLVGSVSTLMGGCDMRRITIKGEENLPTADLTPRELRREISSMNDGYELAVSFAPGADASAATVLEYIFLIEDSSDGSKARIVNKSFDDICRDGRCRAVIGQYNDKRIAAGIRVRAGLRSTIIVRYWTNPGTVLPNGLTCESSDCSSCGCNLCSCAGIVPPGAAVDSRLAKITRVQDLEHLHNVWMSTVE